MQIAGCLGCFLGGRSMSLALENNSIGWLLMGLFEVVSGVLLVIYG